MRKSTLSLVATTAFALTLSLPRLSEAQTWSERPDGNWSYATSYTTNGMFVCSIAVRHDGDCFASGNTLLLIHNDATLQLTYTGVTGSLDVPTGLGGVDVSLGTITQEFGGSGVFAFPYTFSGYPVFTLTLRAVLDDPLSRPLVRPLGAWNAGHPGRETLSMNGAGPRWTGTAPPPPSADLGIGALAFYDFTQPVIGAGQPSQIVLSAHTSFLPEPATLALLGTGLLGLGGFAVTRRRHS